MFQLDYIIYIFSVCSIGSVRQLLTSFKIELAVITPMSPDIRRDVLAGHGGTNGQHHSVNAIPYPPPPEYSPTP